MAVLGIDLGTSSVRAMAFDADARPLSFARAPVERTFSAGGRVEIPAAELTAAFRGAVAQAVAEAGQPIRALACSIFGGALSALDAAGRPLLPVISTTDMRAAPEAEQWSARFGRERTYDITGMPVSPTLALPKMMAVRREDPAVYSQVAQFVSPAELTLHALGAPLVMDLATASTWMALDLRSGAWSEEILAAAEIAPARLPEIAPSGTVIGVTNEAGREIGLEPGTAIVAGGHDQQVCALGAGLTQSGIATDSLGTVECITVAFAGPRFDPLLRDHNFTCLHHAYGGLFCSLAYNFGAGDVLQWYLWTFAPDGDLSALLAALPAGPGPLLVLPHLPGAGTPALDSLSRGAIVGLRLDSAPADILKAITDCQNYEMRVNLDLWAQAGLRPRELRAYGGGARSDYLLQLKADVLDLPVQRLSVRETGCLGAAALAAAAVHEVADAADFVRSVTVERVFAPRPDVRAAHEANYQLYRQLYQRLAPLSHELAAR